jgi:NitT/TauT family transport system substrate-binding protein
MQRRTLLGAAWLAGAAAAAGVRPARAVPRRAQLALTGPAASVSNGLIQALDSGAFGALADRVTFEPWRDPDQLRALVLGGRADVAAMPTNVAANLYNRGAPLALVTVATWGVLWVVSRDPAAKTLTDLRGRELAIPFRGDMPDIVFGLLAERQGMDVRRDLKVRYVATPMDAMQLLLMRQVEHALLPEPAVSMALRKVRSLPLNIVAPALHRAVDLQQEWGRLLQRPPRIPQAGLAVVGALREDRAAVAAVQRIYADAVADCQRDPGACAERVARRNELLRADAVADAISVAPDRPVPAAQARAELEFFFGELLARQPGLIGGRLPDAGFYAEAG